MSDLAVSNTRVRLMDEASNFRELARRNPAEATISRWDCDRGHRWDKTLDLARNVRCMNCAAERRELETNRLREIASVRGGALLSRHYVDATTPLQWQCAYGHEWEARPDVVARHWCADCARTVFAGIR
ncbi:hypothetical protein AWB77_00782 [Caballeronia fortuita]|uniref:Zinc-ribbon domain-containing protein n=1 Tax=Caballeronia fortuita TaxID=1777138 RepID=A0A157ZHM0_9BURK|nr:hypothetical protein [Caballeronia fortuita]SAK45032.1 hypothetical protein AWB77_00782 [Caballeronia fortuita]